MGRANNTSRSLQIISRQQGWDPNEIVDTRRLDSNRGEYIDPRPFPKMLETTLAREDIFKGDTYGGIPDVAADTSYPCPDPSFDQAPTFSTPRLLENQNNRTTEADPYPGKPGAE